MTTCRMFGCLAAGAALILTVTAGCAGVAVAQEQEGTKEPAPERIWAPGQAQAGAPVTPERVRIVDFGTDFLRDGDGRPVHQFGVHRFRVEKDPDTGLYSPVTKQFQLDLNVDVDGDDDSNDDVVGYLPFSLNVPFSPQAGWYDSLAGTPRWYGGATIFQANKRSTGLTENGVNHEHDGPRHYPRDNWALFHERYEINSPYRMYGLWLWKKEDFLNRGDECRVTFDDKSEIALYLQRYWMGCDDCRWVVQDGERFYISEATFRGAGQVYGSGNGKQHVINPADTRWAKYVIEPPYGIDFDAADAEFTDHEFQDVRAVGWLVYKETMLPGYFGFKWYAFEADAVVHRPARPSEHIAMTTVPGAGDVPAFYISTCEVPYELWKNVFRLARSNTFVRDPRGFIFDKDGDMGSMDFPGADGKLVAHSLQEPVTDLTLHDVAAWCNGLSVQESKTPCYYEAPGFETVFRFVRRSPLYVKKRPRPKLYVKWDADGYRLPTSAEWQAAARGAAWTAANGEYSTTPVGQKQPNPLGLYDTAGNVRELVWTWGDSLDPATADTMTVLGGDFRHPQDPAKASANPYGDAPFNGSYNIGFRLVRREAGLPAPAGGEVAADIPRWDIPKALKVRVPAALGVPPKPVLSMVRVPDRNFAIAKYETTFAQWKKVYDWAVAHGYTFDHDGDMGSMDHWGYKDWGARHPHSPDEPVTDLTGYDAMVWCNALSELEGRRLVYYADRELNDVYRRAFVYRPLMMLFFEADKAGDEGLIKYSATLAADTVHADPDADGYRLPDVAEFNYACTGGKRGYRYSWGREPGGVFDHAWLFDTARCTTHPVGRLKPNALGLYDMEGNVSEMSLATSKGSSVLRMGGSFEDLVIGLRASNPPFSPRGWGYPDIGFRVVRREPARTARADRTDVNGQVLFQFDAGGPPMPVIAAAAEAADADPLQGRVYRANLLRNGVFEAPGMRAFKGLKWKFQTGGPVKSSPVVVSGKAYFGSYDGNIYAVDAKTGDELWKVNTGDKVSGSAAVVNGVVYIASENGAMYALDAGTGGVKWKRLFATGSRPAGSPAVAGGVVFIPRGNRGGSEEVNMTNGPTFGLDAENGRTVCEITWGSQGYGSPAIVDGLMCLSNQCYLGGVDLATRKVAWRVSTSGQSRDFVTAAVSGGMAYGIGSIGGDIVAVNLDKGRLAWRMFTLEGQVSVRNGGKLGYEIFGAPAVAHGRVYVGCNDGKLHTFDALRGRRGWTFQTDGPVQSPPAVAGDVVYFGSHDGHLYAVDAIKGELLWKFEAGGRIVSSPWPTDGVIYVASDDGCLYALH